MEEVKKKAETTSTKEEVVEPKISTEPKMEKVVEKPKKEEKKSTALYIIIGILAVMVLGLCGYFVYSQIFVDVTPENTENGTSETVEETETDTTDDSGTCSIEDEECGTEDDTEVATTETFEGDVLSAEIPVGWEVREYMDGNGTEYLLEGETYDGLTGLEIKNSDGDRVFSMMAVTGIGFAGCSSYVQFADDSPSYYSQQESIATDMGDPWDPTDYTSTNYEEFEFLGTTVRRIGDEYYYDTLEGNNYFEAPCVEGLITLEGLYYTDSGGYQMDAYFYGAEEGSTEADLLIVDDILGNLELI